MSCCSPPCSPPRSGCSSGFTPPTGLPAWNPWKPCATNDSCAPDAYPGPLCPAAEQDEKRLDRGLRGGGRFFDPIQVALGTHQDRQGDDLGHFVRMHGLHRRDQVLFEQVSPA